MTHSTAAILSIGDELTLGQSLDTNSQWIASRLVELGITPIEHATVPDDLDAHVRALRRLAARCDVVISTGGLGPTADDLTRQAVAIATGDTLVEDAEALHQIEAWFARRGRAINAINRTQALRPGRGRSLENTHGTAPGLYARLQVTGDTNNGAGRKASQGVDIYCLPGPPREMMPMFERFVASSLYPPPGRVVRTLVLPTVGLGESDIALKLGELMDRGRDVVVGTTASKGIVSVRIRYEGGAQGAAARVREAEGIVRERLGEVVFRHGDVPLASEVLQLLRAERGTLATVESCTGGMLGEMITQIAGSSDTYLGGFVTYANSLKVLLGVSGAIFEADGPGAVSGECALSMAAGGLAKSGASHCLAITGIAGPGGGSVAKPAGTVWIAHAEGGMRGPRSEARRFLFAGDRANIREWACLSAMAMLRAHLIGRSDLELLRELERTR